MIGAANRLAYRYARSLFQLTQDGNYEKVLGELELIAGAMRENRMLRGILTSPFYGVEIKKRLFDRVFKGGISDMTHRLFERLIERNKAVIAGDLYEHFKKMYFKERGIVEAEVVFADEPPAHILEELKKIIKSKMGCNEVRLKVKVDRNLIGGFICFVEGKMIDLSVKGALEKLRS